MRRGNASVIHCTKNQYVPDFARSDFFALDQDEALLKNQRRTTYGSDGKDRLSPTSFVNSTYGHVEKTQVRRGAFAQAIAGG